MSVTKRLLRIQRTLDFLQKDEDEKNLRSLCRAQVREENRHKKDILVIDSGRPVYFWHWKVNKNSCDHGYMFIKTKFKINSVDKVLQVEDDQIITSPITPRVGLNGSVQHKPLSPDTPTPRSQDEGTPVATPRPPDNLRPSTPHRSIRSQASVQTTDPVNSSTPRNQAGNDSVSKNNKKNKSISVDMGRNSLNSTALSSKRDSARASKVLTARKAKMRHVMVSPLRGTRVIARSDKDGLYYPGKVLKCPNVRHATVEFPDGQREVLTRFVLPVGGAVACPPLSVGDYALVQVVNLDQASECYVPCIVQFTPQRREAAGQFYTVMLYNGQKVTTRRLHLVKISKERFELSSRYIAAVQDEDLKKTDDKVYISPRNSRRHHDYRTGVRDRQPRRELQMTQNRDSRSRSSSSSSRSSSRPRSPTPGIGITGRFDSPGAISPRAPPSRQRHHMKIAGKRDEERYQNSTQQIKSRSRSRSDSISPTRQQQQKASRSRSRSRSPSSSPDRKKNNKHESRSGSRSRSSSDVSVHESSPAPKPKKRSLRSRSRSTSRSHSRSPSTSSGSRSHSRSRSRSVSPNPPLTDRQIELDRMKKQLEKQHRQRKRLKRKAKMLAQKERHLKKHGVGIEVLEEENEPEEEPPMVTPRLLQLRRTLPQLHVAEEVLARFSDDGWYYRGTIQQNLGDLSYLVEDATGYMERIWREDIISDYDDHAPPLQEDDRVVALHPNHTGSYAPGYVLSVDEVQQSTSIKFFDGQEASVSRIEVYPLPREKYNHDVLHIQKCQQSLLGLSVVARDDESGQYFPAQVKGVEEGGERFLIRWSDGAQTRQVPLHIFSARTRRPRLIVGERVLAVSDPDNVVFMPGQIIAAQDSGLVVRFCDGQVRDDVNPQFCYWLSPGYFDEASYFWKICQPDFGKQR